ncbi:HAMP domain-containing histidine kinase, partial [Candidatus Daviesbacteria bacterium]|nr:HAMP domain-containing histidine kinase [Candidatus Daviesbacteria bacterium]
FLYFAPMVLTILVFGIKELVIVFSAIMGVLVTTYIIELGPNLLLPDNLASAVTQLSSIIVMAVFTGVMSRELLAERQAKERLTKINYLKDEFVALTSHYLRTPLTAIKGFISLMTNRQMGPLTQEQSQALTQTQANVQRLETLTEELLNISNMESEQIKIIKQPVDLKEIVVNVAKNYGPTAFNKKIKLLANLPANLPQIKADREKITEAISALVDNSIKFTKHGQVVVSLKSEGGNVLIEVADTGIGISEDQIPTLFQKFHRQTDYLNFEYQGTGLGLYIAKLIIDAHGGKIDVQSKIGVGSKFTISIPIN